MFARRLTSSVALATLVALASSVGAVGASASPAWDPNHHSPVVPTSDHGRGAAVPFTEYSAVGSKTNGTEIGPSYNLYTLAAEAVGRTAVTLSGAGQYVDFTLAKAANAVDLRYSIPDSADGTGLTTPLKVYVDGHQRPDLTLTSKYTWFYGSYPFTNDPADLGGHHMYDDVRTQLGRTLPAGTHVRFEIANPSIPVTINVADFQEVAPPAPQPPRLDLGAVLRGGPDRPDRLHDRNPERDQRRQRGRQDGLHSAGQLHRHRAPDRQQRDADRRGRVVLGAGGQRRRRLRQPAAQPKHQRPPVELRHLRPGHRAGRLR